MASSHFQSIVHPKKDDLNFRASN
uniref:Uncharacterized protein n=1 Tax=Rhizophora mucronata TaxID=61149 RepID=A0A2P2QJG8_RHIMU